jgi:hypothetical protein
LSVKAVIGRSSRGVGSSLQVP